MKSRPDRKVPAVRITARDLKIAPVCVRTPQIFEFSKRKEVEKSAYISNLQLLSRILRQHSENWILSHCARGLHIAGPFDRLSIRNWRVLRSVTTPVHPPSASISRTIWPLAIPPTAGLQDILAKPVMSIVTSRTVEPSVAAAIAASQPACPPPTTMMSYNSPITVRPSSQDNSFPSGASAPSAPRYGRRNRSGAAGRAPSPGPVRQ